MSRKQETIAQNNCTSGKIVKIIILFCYCIPFVFLAMNEDATAGTLWFYLIMILGFITLCYACIKTRNYFIVIIGNVASFISSCIFALNFYTDKWEYYFKPFSPNQLIIFETVIAFLIQIIFVIHSSKKTKSMEVNNMKKLLSIILSITFAFTISTAVFADGIDGPMQPAKIKVGINAQFPPFEYYNENGELYGFDIDLMNCIGERIGFEIEYVDMSFDKLIPAVASGEVACSISAISITEERNNVIDYTIPYLSAKVTHIDGETSDTSIEQYAVVFPNNSAEKGKITEAAGEPETSLYNLVNNALSDLIEDKTIEKLGEKYELNKAADTETFDYEYTVIAVPDDFDKSNMDKSELSSVGQTSGTSVPYSDWAKSDIEKAIALNIINVGGNYNFPAPITREEFCELIYNYCANVIRHLVTFDSECSFTDTDNEHIKALNEAGIINGKSETKFAPQDYLTREEAAVILSRMVNKTIPVPVTEMYFSFDDEASISDWASDAIQVMCNMGVMNGMGENKFAPQDTYTTEQAIVTIVRVYAAQSANTGIIGGADTATEIYIGEDATVSDFYIEEAFKHTKKAGELAGTKEFISMYIGDNEVKANIEKLSKTDFEKPAQMYYVSYNIDKVIEYYNKMLAEENHGEKIDIEKFVKLNGFSLAYFANQINGRYGGTTLAATSVLTSREGYIMPEDFENDFGIYLQYEGDYSALVTFNKIGEGVIEARMHFVRNGEKADMLMFMSEFYDALGEESITIGKIKSYSEYILSNGKSDYILNSDISFYDTSKATINKGQSDGFSWKEYEFRNLTIKTIDTGNFEAIIKLTALSNEYKTLRGICVGDSITKVKEAYPQYLIAENSDYGTRLHYENSNEKGFNNIYFYYENNTVTKIVMENTIDG